MRQSASTKAMRQTIAMNQSFLREAFGDRELGKTGSAGSIARKLPSTVIHDDDGIVRNTDNILASAGKQIRRLSSPFERKRDRRVTARVISEASDVLMNTRTALTRPALGVLDDLWKLVRHIYPWS